MRKFLVIALLPFFWALPLHAQEDDSRQLINQAEQAYEIGQIEEAQNMLRGHLEGMNSTLKLRGYRLLSLCCLALDQDDEARRYASLVLKENPYYSPTAEYPPRFVDMITELRQGQIATITTASNQSESINEAPSPVTIITAEMIEELGYNKNLNQILAAYVPGMVETCPRYIGENLAMHSAYSYNQELILIMENGHRLNSREDNIGPTSYSISTEKIDHIEVLRGPASSLYGNVAVTAVVNIITRKGGEVDGIELRAGGGSHGQVKAGMIFGKRYFDLDMLIWGNLYRATGESFFIPSEETGLGIGEGDVTVGAIGPKPSYDVGIQMKYKNLQFFFNSAFSQVTSPFTMSYTFSPYTFDKYRTFNGLHPGFTTLSHHANLSYGQQVGNVYLRGTVTYDNSDLTHYQVISEPEVTALAAVLPVPQSVQQQLSGTQGISRYINGQEHTIGGKLQGDWNYIDNGTHRGLLTFGAEYSYFQLDDVRYTFGYNFTKLTTENDTIPMLGKGHESNLNGFIQLKHHWRSFILNAGLRFDYKNRYDGSKIREFSPRLALIYLQPKWNVKLSYSKAFIDAPYFYRKINLFLASMLGYTQYATELDPETLNSWQLTFGATQWIPGLDLEVNAFYNYAKDLIIPQLIEHTNTGFIDTYGLEFSAKYQRRRWSANLNATIQDVSQNKQAYTSYDYALNIPVVTANGVVAWQASRDLRLHAHIGFEGRQHYSYLNILPYGVYTSTINMWADYMMRLTEYEQTPNPDPAVIAKYEEQIDYFVTYANEIKPTLYSEDTLPARVLFDVGASYHLGNVTFTLDVKNLLNHSYRQSGMSTCLVPQRGRWFMGTVAYKF